MSDQDGQSGIPVEWVFEMLADPRRRAVLQYLSITQRESPSVSVDELVEALSRLDTDPAFDDRDELEERLHNEHLPGLDDTGLIEYDEAASEVRYIGTPFLEWVLDELQAWDLEFEFKEVRA